jgi:hypothetical protein
MPASRPTRTPPFRPENHGLARPAQRPFIELNARLARDPACRPITRSKAPLAEHEAWARIARKADLLDA